jgi:hypothetical protein
VTLDDLQQGAGGRYLFHYTDAAAADLIIEDMLFSTGALGRCGHGVYATDIPPVDAGTIDDVITNCYDGRATPVEVVSGRLRPGPPKEWLAPAPVKSRKSISRGI